MFEVPFLIRAETLTKPDVEPQRTGALESKCLSTFDALRVSIHDVARKAYSRGRRDTYMLTAADFR